jgi:hypothetical protein
MTGNVWIDLQMSLSEIEAEIPEIPDELPRIPTVGNAMGKRGLKGPVTQATVSARVERSTTSGTSGRTHQTRNRFRLRRITVGRPWSTALAAGDNQGIARRSWPAATHRSLR